MKRLIPIIFILIISFPIFSTKLNNEDLKYVISYKWGLIHKDAGDAILSLRNDGSHYNISLTAKTKPWADRIFQVRDTLKGKIRIADFKPLSYTKIANEGGKYGKDEITYTYTGNKVTGHAKRLKIRDGKSSRSEKNLEGSGLVFDMLSVFYYLRLVDYSSLKNGQPFKATVFSGSKSELMTIKYLGTEVIKLRNKTQREAFHIKFNFTSEGKKKSSDDIDAWISTDSRHIPLYVVGKLPIGQVRAYYMGN